MVGFLLVSFIKKSSSPDWISYDCMFSPWRWPQMPTGRKTSTQTQTPKEQPFWLTSIKRDYRCPCHKVVSFEMSLRRTAVLCDSHPSISLPILILKSPHKLLSYIWLVFRSSHLNQCGAFGPERFWSYMYTRPGSVSLMPILAEWD